MRHHFVSHQLLHHLAGYRSQTHWTVLSWQVFLDLLKFLGGVPSFQCCGKVPSASDLLNNYWKGSTSSSVNLTRRRGWSPSGPGGFVVFSVFKVFSTSSIVIRKSVSSVLCSLFSNVGMFSRLSRAKTLVKKY